MQLPDLKIFASEPAMIGLATGFAGMSAAAGIQLATNLLTGTSPLGGFSGLATALFLAGVSGSIASLVASRTSRRHAAGLRMAEALARGDFSLSIASGESRTSQLGIALERIAERELSCETDRAISSKDAALRMDQLADALDAVPSSIAIYNRDGLLVSANRAFLTFCLEAGAIVALGMTWHEVMSSIAKAPGSNLPANERQTWINQQESLRSESMATNSPVQFKCSNGKISELLLVKSTGGNTTEILSDVTSLVEAEESALRAIREAVAAESIKQVTISRLSHTIRTPMTGVLAATELLSDSDLDDRQRERLDIIRRSASTLLGVVQDMFDMASHSETDEHSVLIPAPIQRTALVLQTEQNKMHSTMDNLKAKGFEVGCAENLELLCQALKTLAGQNRLPELVIVPDFSSRDQLFARVGTVVSSPHLRVEIDRGLAGEKETVIVPEENSQSIDIVIVESDEVNRIAYANALSSTKLKFRIACTAEEAINLARLLKSKLFLIDMTLPDMDGFQAAMAIRKTYGSKSGLVTLVAMTSHYVGGDKAKCMAAGMNDYVLKPTIGSEMVALAENLFEREDLKKAG